MKTLCAVEICPSVCSWASLGKLIKSCFYKFHGLLRAAIVKNQKANKIKKNSKKTKTGASKVATILIACDDTDVRGINRFVLVLVWGCIHVMNSIYRFSGMLILTPALSRPMWGGCFRRLQYPRANKRSRNVAYHTTEEDVQTELIVKG